MSQQILGFNVCRFRVKSRHGTYSDVDDRHYGWWRCLSLSLLESLCLNDMLGVIEWLVDFESVEVICFSTHRVSKLPVLLLFIFFAAGTAWTDDSEFCVQRTTLTSLLTGSATRTMMVILLRAVSALILQANIEAVRTIARVPVLKCAKHKAVNKHIVSVKKCFEVFSFGDCYMGTVLVRPAYAVTQCRAEKSTDLKSLLRFRISTYKPAGKIPFVF